MRRGNSKGIGTLFLFILAGVIIGSVVGQILSSYFNYAFLNESITIGTKRAPEFIDLLIVRFAFGISVTLNFGTVLGLIMGLYMYFKA